MEENSMDAKKYLKDSARTAFTDYSKIVDRVGTDKGVDLLHAALGLQTESAEFSDMLKKAIFYGKPIDEVNLKEEIGDILWYAALALRTLNTDFETVMGRNIEKLKSRYPDKFTEDKALNRNLDTERKILEE
jgi:NTP pyrophosphatase (non-canonical NTP hydrolase)